VGIIEVLEISGGEEGDKHHNFQYLKKKIYGGGQT